MALSECRWSAGSEPSPPALIVHGESDLRSSLSAGRATAAVPNARFLPLPGVGHCIELDSLGATLTDRIADLAEPHPA